jgi:DNA-binding transcriptional LysR family regulator
LKHDCIIGQVGSEWLFRERNGSQLRIKVPTKLRIRGGDAYREAALAGLGIAQATWWLFRSDFDNGNVVQLLPEYGTGATPINVMFPAGAKQPAKVRAFANFLVQITKERRR